MYRVFSWMPTESMDDAPAMTRIFHTGFISHVLVRSTTERPKLWLLVILCCDPTYERNVSQLKWGHHSNITYMHVVLF